MMFTSKISFAFQNSTAINYFTNLLNFESGRVERLVMIGAYNSWEQLFFITFRVNKLLAC